MQVGASIRSFSNGITPDLLEKVRRVSGAGKLRCRCARAARMGETTTSVLQETVACPTPGAPAVCRIVAPSTAGRRIDWASLISCRVVAELTAILARSTIDTGCLEVLENPEI
jgi:hypothetical protein